MNYLTPQDILVIHAQLIDATGGSHGIRDLGLLLSLVERPKAAFGNKELYPGIFQKTAAYAESLALYHMFLDGNKRTAISASARFLFLNGFELRASNKEVEKFMMKIVNKKMDISSIAKWLEKHSKRTS